MLTKFFAEPFATSGDKTAVPVAVQSDGSVSYTSGYGADYSLDPTVNPLAIMVERQKFNQLMYDITSALGALQSDFPQWITSSDNGGTSFSYNSGAVVRYTDGNLYQSTANANTTTPGSGSWVLFLSQYATAAALASEVSRAEAAEALLAPLASPTFTGTARAVTAAPGTNTTQISTTQFTMSAVAAETARAEAAEALLAPITSPNFSGTPEIGGAPIATQAYASGLVAAETARAEAAEALLAAITSPAFAGVPTTPTPPGSSNDGTIPNTSWVRALVGGNLHPAVPGSFEIGGFIVKWVIGPNDPADTSESQHTVAWDDPFPNACFVALVSMDLVSGYNTGSDNWYQTNGWDVNNVYYQRQRAQNGTWAAITRGVAIGIGY